MKHFLNVLFLAVLFCPFTHVHAQVPCGAIIAPEDIYNPNSPLVSTTITDCGDPFHETVSETTPYTFSIGANVVKNGGTAEVPVGGTNDYRVEGRPLLSRVNHMFFLHDGNDYRYVDTQESQLAEDDYRNFASEFFPEGTDTEPYVQAALVRDDDTYEEDFRNTLYSFLDYVDANFVPTLPKLRAGTYTLVSKEYLLILGTQTLFQKALASVVPTAYAEEPTFPENIFTVTFTIVEAPDVAECCSSVVFLPGIKGSVLKQGTNTLWPPSIWSTDVKQLALTEDGESAPGIYVDGVLNMFYTEPIYQPFNTFMDSLVASNTIAEWKALPYDWRFSPERILQDGVITPDGVVDLIDEIEEIAANSNTGKVTIISHSMGGIMGKAIIARMKAMGKENLIDSFVMVGTPQLGTPQAVASLLHGDEEGIDVIPGVLSLVNKADSRATAQNMQSSYNLLPSEKYFSEVSEPVISFNENAVFTNPWRTEWGVNIDSYQELKSFVTGNGVSRVPPQPQLLLIPEVLDFDLTQNAQYWHQDYDSYEFPELIRVVQIAGWGSKTLKGVEYKTGHYGGADYKARFTGEGDSIVVYPSAISTNDEEIYYFDSNQYVVNTGTVIGHKDLVNAPPVQDTLLSIITESEINSSNVILESKPSLGVLDSELIISVHSPVVLGAYDSLGNFTGISHEQDLENDFLRVTENIPGSSFRTYGESQYLFLPKTGKYRIVYYGTGVGPTTLEIEGFKDDNASPLSKFTDIPTTLNTVATLELDSSIPQDTLIKLDSNGDGVNDSVVYKDGYVVTMEELLIELKTKISNLSLQTIVKKALLANVAILEQILKTQNKKVRRTLAEINIAVQKVEIEALRKKGKISTEDVGILSSILNQIKNKL